MSKRWITVAAALFCALMISFGALASDNLVQNGGAEELTSIGQPTGWERAMWHWDDGVSVLTASGDAFEGAHAFHVRNFGDNDARYQQEIAVEPDTCYKLSAMVKAEGCDEMQMGATISIANSFVSSESVHETDGAWREISLYGRTAQDQTSMTVMLRVGGYGSLNVGQAWFDDVRVVRVSEAEAGVGAASLATMPPAGASYEDEWADADEEAASPIWGVMWLALLYGVVAFVLLFLNARRDKELVHSDTATEYFILALVAAFVVRVVVAVLLRGFETDMNCFTAWGAHMANVGPTGFYTSDMFCDYPPGYMYVLGVAGSIINGFSVPAGGLQWLIVKLVPILCDLGAAYLVYAVVRREHDESIAMVLGILMAFNPAAIIDSAWWGQIDSVLALMLAGSMLLATKGKWLSSLPLFGAAILVKPQALMLAPLGLVMIVAEVAASEEKARVVRRLLLAVVLALAVMVAIALPTVISLGPDVSPAALVVGETELIAVDNPVVKPFVFLVNLYTKTMGQYDYFTVNACNIYQLFGGNWVSLDEYPSLRIFAYVMLFASIAYAAFLYIKAKDRGKIFVVGAMMLAMMFALGPMMHERYLFPAIIMLLIAYAFDRDWRLLVAFVVLSVTQALNMAMVLDSMHMANLDLRVLYGAVSLANVLVAGLLGWTGWEMCVLGQTATFTRVYKPKIVSEKVEEAKAKPAQESLLRPRDVRLNLKRRDAFFMIALTLVYSVVTFTNLGSREAPETSWRSTAASEQVTFDLGSVRDFHMAYYGGICSSSFLVQMSDDAKVWSEAHYADYHEQIMYRWLWYKAGERDEYGNYYTIEEAGHPMKTARYIRITAESPGLWLNEVAFIDAEGSPLPIASVYSLGGSSTPSDPSALIDEQDTVPPYPSYFNGMYFDEIYHGRTAYENLTGMRTYERTHPPLGKVLIMLGVELFGMTPFGWRFVPALFGVLMIPLMYLIAKQLFKRSTLALIAAFLLAVDCMHFTQSRFATLDAIAVFFIMLMYFFMIRYVFMSFYHQKLWRTLVPLGLSGIAMGLAISTKWIGVYGAVGLAILFFQTLWQRLREYRYAKKNLRMLDIDQRRVAQRAIKQFPRNTLLTLAFCVVFFIVIPLVIYYFSFYWQMLPEGGLSIDRVIEQQKYMLSYHTGGALAHSFSSMWYEWPLIVKPMWYYTGSEFLPRGMVSSISCMGNPVVWWGGALAMVWVILRLLFGRSREIYMDRARYPGAAIIKWVGRLIFSTNGDRRYLVIVIGFLAQFVPWMFVSRSTFIYHYFASVPFIILATVAVFEWVRKRSPRAYKIGAIIYCLAALVLFCAFYPIISGTPAPKAYTKYLRWFNWINQ